MQPIITSQYRSIASPTEAILRDRGSKFIGLLYPIAHREEALTLIQAARDAHPKANHHCFAWRLGADAADSRDSDDGEPSGSAGRPMMNALRSAKLTQVLAIVVRYFGGTKLGVPGLIAAYEGAVKLAIEDARIETRTVRASYEIKCQYAHVARLRQHLGRHEAAVIEETYDDQSGTFMVHLDATNHHTVINAIVEGALQLHSIDQWSEDMDMELSWTFKEYVL